MNRIGRRAGFTLLELLLAMGIVSMLMLALYASLSIVVRARESAAAAVAPVKSALQAADFLRQDFESIQPPGLVENGQLSGEFVGTSQGGADMLDFYCIGNDAGWNLAPVAAPVLGRMASAAPVTDVPWSEGSRHVVIMLRTDTDPPTLVRDVTRNLLATVLPDPDEEIICRNVKSFTLRYYDGVNPDPQESWDSTALNNALPVAVEMTLVMLVDSRPGKPPETYTVTRLFPLACATPQDSTAAGGGN
jgi:prepilin-type N-terminal cleavage/methylation domain-containing protein